MECEGVIKRIGGESADEEIDEEGGVYRALHEGDRELAHPKTTVQVDQWDAADVGALRDCLAQESKELPKSRLLRTPPPIQEYNYKFMAYPILNNLTGSTASRLQALIEHAETMTRGKYLLNYTVLVVSSSGRQGSSANRSVITVKTFAGIDIRGTTTRTAWQRCSRCP